MRVCILDLSFRPWRGVVLSLMVATTLAACNEQTDVAEPAPRPVRTVTLEKSEAGVPVVLTGRIEALDEASLGFRLSGRMIKRTVNVGDRVKAGQLLGRLEALNELNALTAAKANVAAAQAKLTQVRNHFERQETLLAQGWTTRANFDQAEREAFLEFLPVYGFWKSPDVGGRAMLQLFDVRQFSGETYASAQCTFFNERAGHKGASGAQQR